MLVVVALFAATAGAGGTVASAAGDPEPRVLLFERAYLQHEMRLASADGADVLSAHSSEWPSSTVFSAVGRDNGTVDVYTVVDSRLQHFDTVVGAPGSTFGASVSVGFAGSLLAVGAPRSMAGGSRTGAVHLYQRSTQGYEPVAILTPPEGADGDEFGTAVSVGGNNIVIGAPGADTAVGADAGRADVYRWRAGVIEYVTTLAPAQPAAGDRYGAALSATAMYAVVGAPGDDINGAQDAGSVTTFTNGPEGAGPWERRATVVDRAGVAADAHFGAAVSSRGSGAVVGAPDANRGRGHVAMMHNLHAEPVTSAIHGPPPGITGFGSYLASGAAAWAVGATGGADGSPSAWLLTQARPSGGERRVRLTTPDGPVLGPVVTLPGVDTVVAAVGGGTLHTYETGRPLTRSAGALHGRHGESVAVDGATAIVGTQSLKAPQEATVYALRDGAWRRDQTLPSPDNATGFGNAVAVDGDVAVVAASSWGGTSGEGGSVHVYQRIAGRWEHGARLDAPSDAEFFGDAVALAGDTLVVGARGSERPGRIYVYRGGGAVWAPEATLTAPAPAVGDQFGAAIDVKEATILVGAPGVGTGRAFVHRRWPATWSAATELQAPRGRSVDDFGFAVGLDDDRVVVSSRMLDGRLTGAVELFAADGDSWTHEQSLATSWDQEDEFGYAVAIEDGVLVVGAPQWGTSRGSGRADVYERVDGQWTSARLPSGPLWLSGEGGLFGNAVALAGGSIIIGAPGPKWGARGAAYAFDVRSIKPGGPYTAAEGGTVELDASATSFPHDGDVRFSWDLDGDWRSGETGEAATRGDESGPRVTARVSGSPAGSTHRVHLSVYGEHNVGGSVWVPITITNSPPSADAGGPYRSRSDSYVTLDARGSSDPGGTPLTYAWDFDGDGAFDDAQGSSPPFIAPAGEHELAVRVTDPSGATDVDTALVKVLQHQTVVVSPAVDMTREGRRITFTGEVTPARSGQPIQLERLVNGEWTPEATALTDDGSYSVRTDALETGRVRYRITAPGDDDHATGHSDTRVVSVYRLHLAVRPAPRIARESTLVRNTGAVTVDLDSWGLAGPRGRRASLPPYRLEPGSAVRFHTGVGSNRPGHVYLNQSRRFWTGDSGVARLRDLYLQLAASDAYGS